MIRREAAPGPWPGLRLVERPSCQPGEKMSIMEGMNIAVHPVIAGRQATAVVCDNYIIGRNGAGDCLHKFQKEISVL